MLRSPVSLGDVVPPGSLVRDGSFESFGNTSSHAPELFVYCEDRRSLDSALANAQVKAVLVRPEMASKIRANIGLATSSTPRSSYYAIVNKLAAQGAMRPALEQSSRGGDCQIHESAYIESSVQIGDRVFVGPGAIIHSGVSIGSDAIIASGVTIGCPGILHYMLENKRYQVAHSGGVHIGERTNLLSRSVVVQGIYPGQPTIVGDDCIVGIHSIVGHDAAIGSRVVISGNCVVAREVHLGPDSYLATGCIVREYCRIGANARCMAGSVVVSNVPSGATVSGNFAENHGVRLRQLADKQRRERLSA